MASEPFRARTAFLLALPCTSSRPLPHTSSITVASPALVGPMAKAGKGFSLPLLSGGHGRRATRHRSTHIFLVHGSQTCRLGSRGSHAGGERQPPLDPPPHPPRTVWCLFPGSQLCGL